MNLFMIRHGEIASNIKKIYAGSSDEELSGKGIYQAEQAAVRLKNYHIHALYTSPMKRALETAQIIGGKIGKKPVIHTAFREMEMGPWEGLSEDDIHRQFPTEWLLWQTRPADVNLPGRETLEELLHRVLQGVRSIYRNSKNRNILVITHVSVIRVLLIWHAGYSVNRYRTISVPNAGIFEIKIDTTTSLL
jgi:broad specificity phosphatase PhoE